MRLPVKISQLSHYSRPEDILGVLLRRVSGLWRRTLNAELATIELTEMQFVLLMAIAWRTEGGESFTQSQLVEQLKFSRALTSQVLQSLDRKELVTKRASADARTPRVALTTAGERKVRAAIKVLERTEADFWADIPEVADSMRLAFTQVLLHHGESIEGQFGMAEDEPPTASGRTARK
jgi:DNA-binding MarR family transcriptional regulator